MDFLKKNTKIKVLVFTEGKWAFGVIFGNLKKCFEERHSPVKITIWDWSTQINVAILKDYDVIYCTMYEVAHNMSLWAPWIPRKRLTFSGHGTQEFLKYTCPNSSKPMQERKFAARDVDLFLLDENVQSSIDRTHLFSVVSHELYRRFTQPPRSLNNVCITLCGADENVFQPTAERRIEWSEEYEGKQGMVKSPLEPLKIVYTGGTKWPNYDPKRHHIKRNIEKLLREMGYTEEHIQFHNTGTGIPYGEQLRDFYQKCDIFLCTSHSEGNPLGAFEVAGCGLTVISTDVGEMPHFITHGVNGFLVRNRHGEDNIVTTIAYQILYLHHNRDALHAFQRKLYENFCEKWTWKARSRDWEMYFTKLALTAGEMKTAPVSDEVAAAAVAEADAHFGSLAAEFAVPSRTAAPFSTLGDLLMEKTASPVVVQVGTRRVIPSHGDIVVRSGNGVRLALKNTAACQLSILGHTVSFSSIAHPLPILQERAPDVLIIGDGGAHVGKVWETWKKHGYPLPRIVIFEASSCFDDDGKEFGFRASIQNNVNASGYFVLRPEDRTQCFVMLSCTTLL